MNPFSPESAGMLSDYSSDEDVDYYPPIVLRNGKQCLGLAKNYVRSWRSPHAIREFHQNWMDGIKEATGLGDRQYKISDKGLDVNGVYTIEARHPDSDMLLGFILWDNGTIQYSNFGSKLNRSCLNMGVSTKQDNEELAGTHGEGFKVASLVMVRQGYRVRYESSNFYWTFYIGGRDDNVLYCRLSEMSEAKLKKLQEAHKKRVRSGNPREIKGNIWEDVTVKIGLVQGQGKKIEKSEFLEWIKVSLELDRPSKVIDTSHGSLILDERFKGTIYLKGLLLEDEDILPYRFGYNFRTGEVNRDRQKLSNPRQEGRILARIWGEAINHEAASVVSRLVELLQGDKDWADVSFAEDYLSEETARAIWNHLKSENVGGNLFYYYEQNGHNDILLINKSLKMEPAALKKKTWVSLRKFHLVRTPEEQRQYLLQNAPVATLPKTPYSRDVQRVLRAVLALDSRTQELQIEFRDRKKAELDLLLLERKLLINDKWLDFNSSHEQSSCSTFREANAANIEITRFSCSHIVENLYDLILVELSKGHATQKAKSPYSDDYLRLMVSEKIDQMPCKVDVLQGSVAGMLVVEWFHAESAKLSRMHSLELMGRITMHRESTCSDKKLELLTSGSFEKYQSLKENGDSTVDGQAENMADCGCLEQILSLKEFRTEFHGLSHDEKYFPMIARTDFQAFFALPPEPLRPNALVPSHPDTASTCYTLSSDSIVIPAGKIDHSAPLHEDAFNDIYDVSDNGLVMDNDTPVDGSHQSSPGVSRRLYASERSSVRPTSGFSLYPNEANMRYDGTERQLRQSTSNNNQVSKLKKEIEEQNLIIQAKSQLLEELETEMTKLRSHLEIERRQKRQLEDQSVTKHELLVTKAKELHEVKVQLAAQTTDLKAKITAINADEKVREKLRTEIERLHGSISMVENALQAKEQEQQNHARDVGRLQILIDTANEELRIKESKLLEAQASAPIESKNETTQGDGNLTSQNRDLRKRQRDLESKLNQTEEYLKQAEEDVASAVGIASNVASRAAKRRRIKLERDGGKDLAWLSAGSPQHAKLESANRIKHEVIELD